MTESEKRKCEETSTTSKQKSSQNYGGFFWGIVIASFGIFSYVMNVSTYEFQRTSKISLALVLLASGAFGALVGEKFMEKLGEWLKWFFESKNHMAKNSKYAILASCLGQSPTTANQCKKKSLPCLPDS